jgi:hypothetical protein
VESTLQTKHKGKHWQDFSVKLTDSNNSDLTIIMPETISLISALPPKKNQQSTRTFVKKTFFFDLTTFSLKVLDARAKIREIFS